jgi:uncharacterized protein YaiE (UPF0345 family)
MFKVNEYFEGKVISLSHEGTEGKATVGVIAPGGYTFGTTTVEVMTVVSGNMQVKLPGDMEWRNYGKSESFRVEKGVSFSVQVETDTPYHCLYL